MVLGVMALGFRAQGLKFHGFGFRASIKGIRADSARISGLVWGVLEFSPSRIRIFCVFWNALWP